MSKWALIGASSLPGFCSEKINSRLIADTHTVGQWNTTVLIQALKKEHGKVLHAGVRVA